MIDIKNLAVKFVNAIKILADNGTFKDRLLNFPNGCCDDACDLFAYYLLSEFGVAVKQFNGYCESKDVYHNWLVMEEHIIIDLTIMQFQPSKDRSVNIYFGPKNDFYSSFENVNQVPNCDILCHPNLYVDYKLILCCLSKI